MKDKTVSDTSARVTGPGHFKEAVPGFDIIELGRAAFGKAGTDAVTALRQAFPDKAVLADLNGEDGAAAVTDIFEAGADLVRVSGQVSDPVIASIVKVATARHRSIVVDLSEIPDKAARAREVLALGAAFVEFLPGLLSRPIRSVA